MNKKKPFAGVYNAVLDLHGKRHHEVERLVENFIFMNQPPLQIITGDSVRMKTLVKSVVQKHNMTYRMGDAQNGGFIAVVS